MTTTRSWAETVFTVVCTYRPSDKTSPSGRLMYESRLFYDCVEALTQGVAIATVTAKCPGTPTDILVFPGELYDIIQPAEEDGS